MSKKGNKNRRGSSTMLKISTKVAMYLVGILILVMVCKTAFEFGALIYTEDGMDSKGQGKEIEVTIPVDSTTSEIASILKENNLIENGLVFIIQTYLYEADINSGTYTLSTEYSPEELIDALRPSEKK